MCAMARVIAHFALDVEKEELTAYCRIARCVTAQDVVKFAGGSANTKKAKVTLHGLSPFFGKNFVVSGFFAIFAANCSY